MPAPFNLKDFIGLIVTDDLNVAYKYLRKSEENVDADNHAFPAVVFIEPDQGGWTTSANGTIKRFSNCFFQFITQFEMGQDATARDSAIESMRMLAERFINKILASDSFEVILTDINFITIIDKYDANVVGVEINIPKLTYTFPTPC